MKNFELSDYTHSLPFSVSGNANVRTAFVAFTRERKSAVRVNKSSSKVGHVWRLISRQLYAQETFVIPLYQFDARDTHISRVKTVSLAYICIY